MHIGIYDSGFGGISVLGELIDQNSLAADIKFTYYADHANAPYGTKSETDLIFFLKDTFNFFETIGVDIVISACNTSSNLIYDKKIDLETYSFQCFDLFTALKKYLEDLGQDKAFLYTATKSNIGMGAYTNLHQNVFPQTCVKLVPLIESGDLSQAILEYENYIDMGLQQIRFSQPLLSRGVEVIIGCTHYAFLTDRLSDKYDFINPAKLISQSFIKSMGLRSQRNNNAVNGLYETIVSLHQDTKLNFYSTLPDVDFNQFLLQVFA